MPSATALSMACIACRAIAPTALHSEMAALADPNRLKLLAALDDTGELAVSDLAAVINQRLSTTSQQLRLLRSAGIVTSRRDGQRVLTSLTSRGADLLKAALS